MSEATTYVGLDVHKKDIAVCLLSVGGEVSEEWTVAHTKPSVKRLIRRLRRAGGSDVECGYEAGPCGYALLRQFHAASMGCQVVAALARELAGFVWAALYLYPQQQNMEAESK